MIDKATELRISSLKEAACFSLSARFTPGVSKYAARMEYNLGIIAKARADGASEEEIAKLPFLTSPNIHSYETYNQYKYECERYAAWLAVNYPDVQKLSYAFRKGYARKYIQTLIDRGLAASTIAHATSALAKLHGCRANDIHDKRPKRHYAEFTRSRGYNEKKYKADVEKYGPIVELCRMTGVRECELKHLYKECFVEDEKGKIHLHLDGKKQHTKGGRTRDVVILEENQEKIRALISSFEEGKLICPKAPSHLDIHGIRSMYATDYYNAIARDVKDIPATERIALKKPKKDRRRPNQVRTSAPGVYTRRSDGRSFDRSALLTVSESLGHSREDVVVHSYLR